MIELPEAVNLAKQLTATVKGKQIAQAIAAFSPHKFAWYFGDPKEYDARLRGKALGAATSWGGIIEMPADDAILLFSDGVVLRFHDKDTRRPSKHQLLLEFADGTALSASVQMYGGLICSKHGEYQNPYYKVAREKPSPLSNAFDKACFDHIIASVDVQKLSSKALLATEQRIPGLGNGVLQDILFNAGVHPKRKLATLTGAGWDAMFHSVRSTLKEMMDQGGRDVEKDLFGRPGGYRTKLSQNTVGKPCPVCGSLIVKEPYMGGSIYFCRNCQPL